MNDRTVFYCISDKGSMVPQLIKSLKTLNRFVSPENVLIYITPPHKEESKYQNLKQYARIEFRDNLTEPFWANKHAKARWGEMFQFTRVDEKDVIYIDHDTWILKNPFELLEGDYDVAFRVASTFISYYDIQSWNEYFLKNGKTPIPMPNGGLVILKNHIHKKLASEIFRIFEDPEMVHGRGWQNRDEITLALAFADCKIRWLTPEEYCYRWKFEVPIRKTPYIVHGDFDLNYLKNLAILNFRALNSLLFWIYKGKRIKP